MHLDHRRRRMHREFRHYQHLLLHHHVRLGLLTLFHLHQKILALVFLNHQFLLVWH
jgi:hypothetical protein